MENTKIWFLADTHFGCKGDDEIWLNDYISYFEETLIPIMEKEVKPGDILVHLGDVFDNRSSIGLHTLYRVVNLFDKFSKIFKDIRIVVGNHDCFYKNSTDVTSVVVLKYIPNIKIYYEPTVDIIDGKKILFNPWIENLEKEKEVIKNIDVDYVFGHLMIGGSQTTNRSGIKVDVASGVSVGDFKNAQVFAGHIHINQNNKNIHYVGNPYHKDRGDRDNIKGITILDVKSGKTEFIENEVSPIFLKESIYDIINLSVGDLKKRWKNNYIDLHISGKDYNMCNFDDLRECMSGVYKEFKTKCDDDVVIFDTDCDLTFDDAKTSNEYINDFLDLQDLSDDNRERMSEKIKRYFERVC